MGKLIVFTAPSGAGKTTIVRYLIKKIPALAFSVSATTRYQRAHEEHGKDYYFLSTDEFKQKIQNDAFVEWEEVYTDQFYGTLKSEIERLWQLGKHIIFDIDVNGAMNIKKSYPKQTLTIFVKPPSIEVLLDRLQQRQTESTEQINRRMEKAQKELAYDQYCDYVLLNDDLNATLQEAKSVVSDFIKH